MMKLFTIVSLLSGLSVSMGYKDDLSSDQSFKSSQTKSAKNYVIQTSSQPSTVTYSLPSTVTYTQSTSQPTSVTYTQTAPQTASTTYTQTSSQQSDQSIYTPVKPTSSSSVLSSISSSAKTTLPIQSTLSSDLNSGYASSVQQIGGVYLPPHYFFSSSFVSNPQFVPEGTQLPKYTYPSQPSGGISVISASSLPSASYESYSNVIPASALPAVSSTVSETYSSSYAQSGQNIGSFGKKSDKRGKGGKEITINLNIGGDQLTQPQASTSYTYSSQPAAITYTTSSQSNQSSGSLPVNYAIEPPTFSSYHTSDSPAKAQENTLISLGSSLK